MAPAETQGIDGLGPVAARLLLNGYVPLPIEAGGKGPIPAKWQRLMLPATGYAEEDWFNPDSDLHYFVTSEAVGRWWRQWPGAGLGVSACDRQHPLAIIDGDDARLVAWMTANLPATVAKRGRPERLTMFYRASDPVQSEVLGELGSILGAGRQSVVPPTIHPGTRAPNEWVYLPGNPGRRTLLDTTWADLPELPAGAAGAIIAEAVRLGVEDPRERRAEIERRRLEGSASTPALREDVLRRRNLYEIYARRALVEECATLAAEQPGRRNHQLLLATMPLMRFVGAGLLAWDEVHRSLMEACAANGLIADPDDGPDRCERTIAQGSCYGSGRILEAIPGGDPAEAFGGRPGRMPPGASPVPVPPAPPRVHAEAGAWPSLAPVGVPGPDWPDPDLQLQERVTAELPPVPLAALEPWADFLRDVSEHTSSSIEYVVANHLVSVATACGGVVRVRPWDRGSWEEPIILRAACVGPPSYRKTPAQGPFRRALEALQEALQHRYRGRLAQWEQAQAATAAGGQSAAPGGGLAPLASNITPLPAVPPPGASQEPLPGQQAVRRARPPERPEKPFVVVQDSTVEKLALLMRARPGLCIYLDELSLLFGSFGRYRQAESAVRGFLNEAYQGGRFSAHRIGRETVEVECCAANIIGNMTPDMCSLLLTGDGQGTDGLAERNMYVWPAEPRPVSRPGEPLEEGPYRRMILEAGLDDGGLIRLDHDPQERFFQWYKEHERRILSESTVLQGVLGKSPGLLLRLVGTLAVASGGTRVDAALLDRGLQLLGWLEAHVRRTFREAAQPSDERGAAALARYILETGISTLNVRALKRRAAIPGLRSPQAMDAAIETLAGHGWIRLVPGSGPGRPRGDYEVNPKIWRRS